MKFFRKCLYTLAIVYLPCLFIFPLFIEQSSSWWQTPYWWNLLVCFLMSFPFYLAFIEICFIVGCLSDKKPLQRGVRSVRNRIRRLAKSSFVCVADIGNPAIINVYWYAYRVDYFYALQKTKRC